MRYRRCSRRARAEQRDLTASVFGGLALGVYRRRMKNPGAISMG